MAEPASRVRWEPVMLAMALGLCGMVVAQGIGGPMGRAAILGIGCVVAAVAVYVIWLVPPSWSISAALVLTLFGGNWDYLGLPGALAPDRLVLLVTIAAVLLRAPGAAHRAPLRVTGVHWLIGAFAAYAVGSALWAGTFLSREGFFSLLDRIGLLGLLIFVLAPAIFPTRRDREVLMGTLVVIGCYLGVTALLETIGASALVWPAYITDPSVGIHFGRARGPFAQAAINGLALYASIIAALLALRVWSGRSRRLVAFAAIAVCAPSLLFTLQRSIWLGATAATLLTLLVVPRLRRYVVPVVASAAVVVVTALAVIPGLADRAAARRDSSGSVEGRQALNAAAFNMIERRPMLGFGFATFPRYSDDYFETADGYSTWTVDRGLVLHNAYLANAVELGLVGGTLWLAVLLLGIGGAIFKRGPPELVPWRIGLGALLALWLVVANTSPLRGAYQSLLLWVWAAAIVGARDEAGS
jgi:putative inorganic carbon (hco3(-)) transporter